MSDRSTCPPQVTSKGIEIRVKFGFCRIAEYLKVSWSFFFFFNSLIKGADINEDISLLHFMIKGALLSSIHET